MLIFWSYGVPYIGIQPALFAHLKGCLHHNLIEQFAFNNDILEMYERKWQRYLMA